MSNYFNLLNDETLLEGSKYCAIQPYICTNDQINLLLRNHNWSANLNTAVEVKYKIILNPSKQQAETNGFGFWENEGKAIKTAVNYISQEINKITGAYDYLFESQYLPEYIVSGDARDEYKLYESNYANSDSQMTYILETKLENIKRKLENYSDNDNLKQFEWIKSVDTVFNITYKNIKSLEYLEHDEITKYSVDKNSLNSDSYINLYKVTQHIFNSASEVAGIKFSTVTENEKANLELKLYINMGEEQTVFPETGSENFYYDNGKTIYAEYYGPYIVKNNTLNALDWKDAFHVLSHILLDHPQDSVFAPDLNLHDEVIYASDISNEYKAYSPCMSVMNTIFSDGCSFQDKLLYPISYLPIDVQALQYMYGKNFSTRNGDNTYIITGKQTFVDNLNSPLFPMYIAQNTIYTLYDAGGTNTLDLTLVKNAHIDLNQGAGHFNVVEDNIFLIAYNTSIHNLIIDGGNIQVKLTKDLSHSIYISSKAAKVNIDGFDHNKDRIIIENNYILKDFEEFGCVKPYSFIGDIVTEICMS